MNKTVFIYLGGYLPAKKYGGPVTSISNLVENLGDTYDFRIVTSNHDFKSNDVLPGINNGWNKVGKAHVLYLKEADFKYKNFKKIMQSYDVSMVYLSSVFYYSMNFPAIRAAKKLNIPILLAPRGEINSNAINIKKHKKIAYVKLIKYLKVFNGLFFQATSEEEKKNISKYLVVPEERVFLLPNMPATGKINGENTKVEHELKIVFVSRIQQKKNLLYAIDIVTKLKGKVTFDIFGPIEQEDYWKKCEELIKERSSQHFIKYQGELEPGETKKILSQYDCFLFPTFSENYGHVIVESMLSGCPVIISKNTTPWDDVDNNGGYTVDLSDTNTFINRLNSILNMDENDYQNLVKQNFNYIDNKLKSKELSNNYKEMIKKVLMSSKIINN